MNHAASDLNNNSLTLGTSMPHNITSSDPINFRKPPVDNSPALGNRKKIQTLNTGESRVNPIINTNH